MSKKIISFSLFGDKDIYCIGAIENAKLSSKIYEGWIVRFYVDNEVPNHVIDELKKYNCEIILNEKVGTYDGLFWRFKPLYDDEVSIWVSRDCDSRISYREKACVDEWIASDKPVHIIRDSINHSYEIMAGMFGVNNQIFKQKYTLPNLILENSNNLTDDQTVLLENLWPMIQNDHLCHDFWFNKKPIGEPTYKITDDIHFEQAYGCGLINYVLTERKNRHNNLFINDDVRDVPTHKSIDYGVFIGQKIDEKNKVILTMDTRWEYELRGINKTEYEYK
jgi:hypothetical protein